ncbi:hypothetical protein G7054_g12313 [Neopestalotiopsis clavispora]|nr:hypothetical protein G7054_g12313 [Neopestalotiopsis clavispora]
MSSSGSTQAAAAPWRSLFVEHIEAMKSPEFTLSTIRTVPSSSPQARQLGAIQTGDGFAHIPRARTCIFRGMWAGLPVNPKNGAPLNLELYDSELLTFTTDVRMDKMPELWGAEAVPSAEDGKTGGSGSGSGGGSGGGKLDGTGGGGPVEAEDDCAARRADSDGPVTMHITLVLPISRYDEPSAAAWVLIEACCRRRSFQRRPSTRSSARL